MDDREALLRAAVANPDDDLPRLVYADWLEERDDPDQAAFVRAQCELAATPAWEPFAVRCRARHPDWVTGRPWRYALPAVDGRLLEWHPETGFRRGLGWGLVVRQLGAFLDAAPRLFDLAPIGELHLPTAPLDEWRRFADQPWLPRVKSIHFYGTVTPVEPIRRLCDSLLATGIEEVVFEKASGPAIPELVSVLLASPLGSGLRRLDLRVGPENVDELVETFAAARPGVSGLSLRTIGLAPHQVERLVESALVRSLREFEVADIRGGGRLVRHLTRLRPAGRLTVLRAVRSHVGAGELFALAGAASASRLRLLDVGGQPLDTQFWIPDRFVRSEALIRLRSLSLRGCTLDTSFLSAVLRTRFWSNLVELDLRDNRLTDAGAKHLLAAPVPPDLTALWLGGNQISPPVAAKLRDRFGDAVSFDVGEVGSGLR